MHNTIKLIKCLLESYLKKEGDIVCPQLLTVANVKIATGKQWFVRIRKSLFFVPMGCTS